jgi:hypothetical protein
MTLKRFRKGRRVTAALTAAALMGPGILGCGSQNPVEPNISTQQEVISKSPVPLGAMPTQCFLMPYTWMSQMPPKDPRDSDEVAWTKTYNCGETCVLYERNRYNGTPLSTSEINNENVYLGNPTPYGANTGASRVKQLLEHYGLHGSIIQGSMSSTAASEMVSWGAVGYSSIVGVRTRMSTNGRPHWMLFRGWDGQFLYFNDPGRSYASTDWSAGLLRCTPAQFYASWNSFPDTPRTYIIVWK